MSVYYYNFINITSGHSYFSISNRQTECSFSFQTSSKLQDCWGSLSISHSMGGSYPLSSNFGVLNKLTKIIKIFTKQLLRKLPCQTRSLSGSQKEADAWYGMLRICRRDVKGGESIHSSTSQACLKYMSHNLGWNVVKRCSWRSRLRCRLSSF